MTPRLADIAFVLEGVPGVVDVYALRDSPFEVAVRLEGDAGAAARAAWLRRGASLSFVRCRASR